MEFVTYKLGDLVEIKNGKDHKHLAEGKYPVLGSGGVMRYAESYLYDKASILLPRKGTLTNIQYVEEPFWTVDTLFYTHLNNELYEPYYLYRYIDSLDLSGYDSGASIPSMTKKGYNKIKIDLPSITVQREISQIIKKYDKLIENNNKRIKLLEQMAEELYKEWFVKCRFNGYENEAFFITKPNGWIYGKNMEMMIPKSWHFGKLEEIGKFIRGKNITSSEMVFGNIPVISAGLEPSGYHNESNVIGKSLTISASGANAGFLNYHLNDIWAADCSYYQDESNFWYVYHSLKFIKKAIDNLQIGSAQPHVYPKNINKLCVIIPNQKYINEFNEIIKPFYDEINTLTKQKNNLIKQRDLLLPRLMSGKLEVK